MLSFIVKMRLTNSFVNVTTVNTFNITYIIMEKQMLLEELENVKIKECPQYSLRYAIVNDFFLERNEIDTIKRYAKKHNLYVIASYVNGCIQITENKLKDRRYKQ